MVANALFDSVSYNPHKQSCIHYHIFKNYKKHEYLTEIGTAFLPVILKQLGITEIPGICLALSCLCKQKCLIKELHFRINIRINILIIEYNEIIKRTYISKFIVTYLNFCIIFSQHTPAIYTDH